MLNSSEYIKKYTENKLNIINEKYKLINYKL